MYGDVLSQLASLIDGDVREERGALAYLYALAYIGVGVYLHLVADDGTVLYDGKGAYVHVGAYLCLL